MRIQPRFWQHLPLAGKLLITACTALLVAASLMAYIAAGREAEELRRALRDELSKELDTLPAALAETVAVGDFATLQQTLERYVLRPLIAEIEFEDHTGTVLRATDNSSSHTAPQWFVKAYGFDNVRGHTNITIGGREYGQLRLTLTANIFIQRAWGHLQDSLLILAVAILIDFIGIWLVLRSSLAPLTALQKGAHQIAGGDYMHRLPSADSPELHEVIDAFNLMIEALARSEQQKQAQASELEQQRRRLQDILEGTHVGTWEWYPQTGQVVFNERWAEIVGYTLAELSPVSIQTWMDLAHPDDLERSGSLLNAHFKGEIPYYECEARMRHKAGHWVWVLDRGKVSRWSADGKPLLMSGTHQDISQRKANQQELESHRQDLEALVVARTAELETAKDAAEAASRAKTTFLSMASHELRTPMNGVLGMINLARRRTQDTQIQDQLGKAERASQHLLAIINDILDIARIEADRLSVAESPYTLQEVLGSLLDALGNQAEEKGLRFETRIADTLLTRSYLGDPTRIEQILLNLCGNAIKFTDQGQVMLSIQETGGHLRFEIRDTGIGIEAADQAKIFDPFIQVDAGNTRRFGGTGLGLTLCKRLVTALSGEMGMSSTPNQGSLFWFEIPAHIDTSAAGKDPETLRQEEEAMLRQRHAGAAILVAEDDPINQEIMRSMLEMAGLSVFTADNGSEALESARMGGFKAILMDVKMPVMSGLEATQEIRKIPTHAHTPIIAVTANAFIEDRDACIRAGMNDHIAKPVQAEVLYRTLLRWLEHGDI